MYSFIIQKSTHKCLLLRCICGSGSSDSGGAAGDVPWPVADLHHRVIEGSLLASVEVPLPTNTLTEGVLTITLLEISIFYTLMSVAGEDGLRGPGGHWHRGAGGDEYFAQ